MPSIKDVSRLAGTSVGTVSHVLNNSRQVSPKLRERVLTAAEHLGYAPNLAARTLRSKKSGIIGILISDILNPYYTELVSGIQRQALRSGYHIIVCNSYEDPQAESEHLAALRNYQIDGLIIAPTQGNHETLIAYARERLPIVLVNRRLSQGSFPTIVADNCAAARMATEHFLEHGHTRIGLFLTFVGVSHNDDRIRGYNAALAAAGLPTAGDLVWYRGSGEESWPEVALEFLRRHEDLSAVVCGSASTTLSVLQAARELGRSIPHDLAVIGSGNMPWGALLTPTLTYLTQPTMEMAARATETLLALIRAQSSGAVPWAPTLELPITLVGGGSCGCK